MTNYIGRGIDQIDNISTLDNLSFNGSLTTFNLTQNSVAFTPVSADALQIQIDGIIQSGNYSVANATVTFDFTPSGSSVCNGIKHFGVGVLTTPSDNSVGITQLNVSDGSNGQALTTNGSGTLAFSSVGVSGISSSADATAMTIDSGERVGINSSNMSSLDADANQLVVGSGSGDNGLTVYSDGSSSGSIFFANGTAGTQPKQGQIVYEQNNSTMLLKTANATAMSIDGSGRVTKPLQPCAMWASGNNYNITGDGTSITMGQTAGASLSEIYDLGANLVDGVFTAPVTGKYQMSFNWSLDNLSSNNNSLIIMKTSNREYYTFANLYELRRGSGNSVAGGWSMTVDMDANDVAEWKIQVSDMSKIVDITDLTIGAIHLVA